MNAPTPDARDVLTQDDAAQRARAISGVEYTLDLDLQAKSERYRGDVTISFSCAGGVDTFLDFTGAVLELLEVNGEVVEEPAWSGIRLQLSGLQEGQNTVRLRYENEYNHTGDGLHQFIDPEDGEEYLYSNFEPYNAHWMFPSFDQPDIKARYTLGVTAPADWKLIANGVEESVDTVADGRKRHTFRQTKRFSTYLVALIAGPYEVFRAVYEDIPLGFYARKSLAPHVDQDELFQITEQGLEFYARFFDYSYPFEKYDQVFVPEFNAGAMENVAAVTHTESIVFRDPPTENDRSERAEIILHEMAHMWFGNLVTMRWWNDLWLNESFATYMSYLALTEATRFTTAWQDFNAGMKNWAYTEDARITTHPIAGFVRDTDETFLNFDGITYGKGAAVIKQLVASIGMDAFRTGMRHYFATHDYGNTTLSDWLDSLGEGAKRDIHPWAQAWLETASLNTIAAEVEGDGDRIAALRLTQTAPEDHSTLRPHTMDIALVREECGRLAVDSVRGSIDGDTSTVEAAAGKPLPGLVFPNYGDHGFFKIELDEDSIAFARDHLDQIDDALLRTLIWHTLWTMVRDTQLKSTDFIDLALDKIVAERDVSLVETVLGRITAAVGRYVPEDEKAAVGHRLFVTAWSTLEAIDEPNLKIIWARTLFGTAINSNDVVAACRLADGEVTIEGLTVDQDMRWSAAAAAVAHGLEDAWARVEREQARDRSDRGERAVIRARISQPLPDVKQDAWERFRSEDGYGSLHLTAAAMDGFNWWVQEDLLEPYVEPFFQRLPEVFEHRDNEFAQRFFRLLWPGFRVEERIADRARTVLEQHGDRIPTLRRQLLESIDDLERALRARRFAAS